MKNSITSVEGNRIFLQFKLILDAKVVLLCKKAFSHFANISIPQLNRIVAEVKLELGMPTKYVSEIYSDTTTSGELSPKELAKWLRDDYAIELSEHQLAIIQVPSRSTMSKVLFNWIDEV